VFKPLTSKPGNSEVYVVAECYKTLDDQLLAVLKSHVGLWHPLLISVFLLYLTLPIHIRQECYHVMIIDPVHILMLTASLKSF